MFPPRVTATQSVVVGHEISEKPGGPSTPDFVFQSLASPVGLVDVTTLPPRSTATHKFSDGHEMPPSCSPLVSTPGVARHAPDGSVEVITSLDGSIATHIVEDGHDTALANGGGEDSAADRRGRPSRPAATACPQAPQPRRRRTRRGSPPRSPPAHTLGERNDAIVTEIPLCEARSPERQELTKS
jgi:hypothetical protein